VRPGGVFASESATAFAEAAGAYDHLRGAGHFGKVAINLPG
jgi:hypothetical protein